MRKIIFKLNDSSDKPNQKQFCDMTVRRSYSDSNKLEFDFLEKLQRGILINEFDEDSVQEFRENFDSLNANVQAPYIPIYIDSFGGDMYSLLAMLDIAESAQKPVVTVAIGKAMSCGALLLSLAGNKGYRFATKNCTIMLHDIASFSFGKMEEIRANVKECDRLTNLMFSLLDKKCEKESGYFESLFSVNKHADIYMTSEIAKSHGLIDDIGYPIIVPNIQMELAFPDKTTNEEPNVNDTNVEPEVDVKKNKKTKKSKK